VVAEDLAGVVERFPRLRQSLLASFDACPLSARFDLEHRQGWSSSPAARGTLVHRTIARCLEVMEERDESTIPVDVALSIFDEVLRQADLPMEGDKLGDEVVAIPLREVASARVTVRTWAMYSAFDVRQFAGVERRLSTTIAYPGPDGVAVEREVTGKLDLLLIDGPTAIVCDWKDTWGIPAERRGREVVEVDGPPVGDNVSEEGYFQQRCYALLVFRAYPRVQRVVLREVYPRYLSGRVADRRGRAINPVREAVVDRYALPEIEGEFAALVERFDRSAASGIWRPSPGGHCSYCPRPTACTVFPEARQEGRIASREEAERVAGRLTVLDALRGQATRALRAWSNLHGDVPIPDAKRPKVYGPVVRTRTTAPTAEEMSAHVARGGRPEELYRTQEHVAFVVHTPEEAHPHAQAAREEEQGLLASMHAAAEQARARKPPGRKPPARKPAVRKPRAAR
jgi:hypothetical protein